MNGDQNKSHKISNADYNRMFNDYFIITPNDVAEKYSMFENDLNERI